MEVDLLTGGMGRKVNHTTLSRVTLHESVEADPWGILFGRDIIARGSLTANAMGYTLCL